VTHDQTEAMTMASRIAVMKDGILQQLDTPQVLYDRPANIFVAGFIGSPAMNFFDAKLSQSDGKLVVDCSPFHITLPDSVAGPYRTFVGKQVVVGVRPEDIHDPHFVPPGITTSMAEAEVELTELMGAEIYVYYKSGDKNFMARVDPRTQAKIGNKVQVAFDTNKLQVFNKETEMAIR